VDDDISPTILSRKINIIIAEDDPASQQLLAYFLEDVSKQIFPALTGTEAVALCRTHPEVDLVLMDVKMPELNGYEATKAIRAFNPEVIIIAQTAFGLSGDREKALAAGCNEYLPKPIDKKLLLSVIDRFFG
jgi:CheY-like chemotaxis protein